MKTSQKGVDLIKLFEGFTEKAFRLVVGYRADGSAIYDSENYTYGYGHCGSEVKPGQLISKSEAEKLLKKDLVYFENCVNGLSIASQLNQSQFDALVSFTYNCGLGGLQYLCDGKTVKQIGEALPNTYITSNGVRLQGLVNRRLKEQELFNEECVEMIAYGEWNDSILAYKQHLRILYEFGVIKTKVDNNGGFGDGTKKATVEVQKLANLTADGIVGPYTIKAMYELELKAYNKLKDKIDNAKKALN